jgi:RND family efflux transporter MFP subunit
VRAQLQAENAQEKYNRGKKLFEAQPTRMMSPQDFSDLETALRVARAAYDVEVLTAKSLVASAWALKGDLDIAQQRLTDATTRAPGAPESTTEPHTYVVVQRMVNVGELVREITPCYKLIDDNPIKLRAQVPERHVAQVKVGQKAAARVEAYPGVDFPGTISRVNPQVDLANRMFGIEILIPNDDHRLKSGAFARAAIQTNVQPNVLFVPQEALVSFAGVSKLFTVKDNKAVEINVEPGVATTPDKLIEIAQGLKGGEQIVTSNASKLANGVPVEIKPAGAP